MALRVIFSLSITTAIVLLASQVAADAQQANSAQGRRDASAAQGLKLEATKSQVFGFALPTTQETVEEPTRFSTRIGRPIQTQILTGSR